MLMLTAFHFMLNTDPNDIDIKVVELQQGEHIIGDFVKQYLRENNHRTFVGLQVIEDI